MISIIFALSGGPPAAALITSAASRKYCGPSAAGVITHSTFTSWLPLLSNPCWRTDESRRAECQRSQEIMAQRCCDPHQSADILSKVVVAKAYDNAVEGPAFSLTQKCRFREFSPFSRHRENAC